MFSPWSRIAKKTDDDQKSQKPAKLKTFLVLHVSIKDPEQKGTEQTDPSVVIKIDWKKSPDLLYAKQVTPLPKIPYRPEHDPKFLVNLFYEKHLPPVHPISTAVGYGFIYTFEYNSDIPKSDVSFANFNDQYEFYISNKEMTPAEFFAEAKSFANEIAADFWVFVNKQIQANKNYQKILQAGIDSSDPVAQAENSMRPTRA